MVAVGAIFGGGVMVGGGVLAASFALGRRVGLDLTWGTVVVLVGVVAWGVVELIAWTHS